jgi:hypothetical protein
MIPPTALTMTVQGLISEFRFNSYSDHTVPEEGFSTTIVPVIIG